MSQHFLRQREDGTYTYATPEHDAAWYWPVGTRVSIRGSAGVIVKENAVSSWVAFDSGPLAGRQLRVNVRALTRVNGGAR